MYIVLRLTRSSILSLAATPLPSAAPRSFSLSSRSVTNPTGPRSSSMKLPCEPAFSRPRQNFRLRCASHSAASNLRLQCCVHVSVQAGCVLQVLLQTPQGCFYACHSSLLQLASPL